MLIVPHDHVFAYQLLRMLQEDEWVGSYPDDPYITRASIGGPDIQVAHGIVLFRFLRVKGIDGGEDVAIEMPIDPKVGWLDKLWLESHDLPPDPTYPPLVAYREAHAKCTARTKEQRYLTTCHAFGIDNPPPRPIQSSSF